ncbi:MAG: hypothetical protein CM15mP113_2920 [Pseudomonadota bacterium]|nr:MAG: hypothetical protein CM15mP113_2920 [Pseudomonadota bacterium]
MMASATGLSTGTYFVNRVSSRRFQLAETILDINSNPVRTVSITIILVETIYCTNKSKNRCS